MSLKLSTLAAVSLYIVIVFALKFTAHKYKGKKLGKWANWLLAKLTAGVMGSPPVV